MSDAGAMAAERGGSRISTAAAFAVALACLAGSIALQTQWNAATRPLFDGRNHPVLHRALLFDNEWAPYEVSSMVPDNRPWLFVAVHHLTQRFGRTYPVIMGIQTALFALWALTCAWLGGRLGGARAAAWALAAASVAPIGIVVALGFDDHMFNVWLTVLAAALMVEVGRRVPVAGVAAAGLCAGIALRFAFIPSNGLLTVMAVSCAVAGWLWETRSVRSGPKAEVVAVLVFAAAVVFAAAWGWSLERVTPEYYAREMGRTPAEGLWGWLVTFPIYPYLIARHALAPVVASLTIWGLWRMFKAHADGRWMTLVWLVAPVALLCAVPKKNPYYLFNALAAAPVAVGVSMATLRRDWTRWAAAALLVVGGGGWSAWHMTRDVPWEPPAVYDPHIQGRDAYMLRTPDRTPEPDEAEAANIVAAARARRSPEDVLLFIVPGRIGPMERQRYYLQRFDERARLFDINSADSPPPALVAPFVLMARDEDVEAWNEGLRGALALIENQIRAHLEETNDAFGMIESAGDPVARIEYLKNLSATADGRQPIYQSERYRLYDFAQALPIATEGRTP